MVEKSEWQSWFSIRYSIPYSRCAADVVFVFSTNNLVSYTRVSLSCTRWSLVGNYADIRESPCSYFGDPGRLRRIAIRIIFGRIFIGQDPPLFSAKYYHACSNHCFVSGILAEYSWCFTPAYLPPDREFAFSRTLFRYLFHHWFPAEMFNIFPIFLCEIR